MGKTTMKSFHYITSISFVSGESTLGDLAIPQGPGFKRDKVKKKCYLANLLKY